MSALVYALLGALSAAAAQAPAPSAARIVKLTNIETSYPHWSPDGRRIVYQSNRTGNSEIYVMNADGSAVTQLTSHPAIDENPAWSPDGRRIAFRSYRDGNAEIYSMAADGSDLRNLTQHPADDIHPYWSPDGSRVIFNSNRVHANGTPTQMIFSMRSDGTDVRQISRDGIEDTYAHYSPDGSRIVLRRRLAEETPGWERNPGNSDIFVMHADGTNATRLTTHPGFDGWPSWSPDGRWIAYAGEGAGDFQVLLMRPDGTGLRALTNGPGSFTKPIFSPDGRRIVCTRTLDGNVEIFIIELAADGSAAGTPALNARALIERAATRMGGITLLERLPLLTTGYHMLERSLGQGEWPQGAVASSVQVGTRETHPGDQREHLQMRRHMSGGRIYDRTLDGGRWHRISDPHQRQRDTPPVETVLSTALAAIHPESLLPHLLRGGALDATLQPMRTLDNRRVAVVLTRLAGVPLTVYFDDDDEGLLRGIEWQDAELSGIHGQSIRVSFAQYRPAMGVPGSPRLPHLVEIWRGGELWQVRSYDEYGVAAAPRPGGGQPPTAPPAALQEVEVAPGVFQVRIADYGTLLVDMPDRVLVVDLPDSEQRGRLILAHARQRARGRAISVALTHFHDDHIGGLLDAADLDIIAEERLLEDVRRFFTARNMRAPRLTGVRGTMRIGQGDSAVELRSVPHSHSAGALVAYMPAHGLLYEADLVRGLLPHSTFELVAWVEAAKLNVRTVVSSHGQAQPWARVVTAAQAWQTRLTTRPPQ